MVGHAHSGIARGDTRCGFATVHDTVWDKAIGAVERTSMPLICVGLLLLLESPCPSCPWAFQPHDHGVPATDKTECDSSVIRVVRVEVASDWDAFEHTLRCSLIIP